MGPAWLSSSMHSKRLGMWAGRKVPMPSPIAISHMHYWPDVHSRRHKFTLRRVRHVVSLVHMISPWHTTRLLAKHMARLCAQVPAAQIAHACVTPQRYVHMLCFFCIMVLA